MDVRPPCVTRERGSAVVEFVLVSVIAVTIAMAVVQLALDLYQRNVLMGSLSEGARVAAAQDRTVTDGRRRAELLVRETAGTRLAAAVPITASQRGDLVVLRAEGSLPSFLPGFPGVPIRMTASMHKEESL
jgi:TadE-like protein